VSSCSSTYVVHRASFFITPEEEDASLPFSSSASREIKGRTGDRPSFHRGGGWLQAQRQTSLQVGGEEVASMGAAAEDEA